MKKFLVIDGNSILNRAFYGIRLLTNRDGLFTNAIYGMVTMISRQVESLQPDYCAVAFDLKAPTFRHRMYDAYKSNRTGMPDELAVQLPYAKECMTALGFSVLSNEGYEADDILGTLAHLAKAQQIQTYIMTGDRDSLQLIDDQVSVLLVRTKETTLFDRTVFRSEYGVDASQFVDVKALMGDSSDCIPGVKGIGEKTALKLIAQFGSLQGLYESLEASGLSDGVKKKLIEGREMAYLSRDLSAICTEVPLEQDLEQYAYQGVHRQELYALFEQLDFSALIKKFGLEAMSQEKRAEMLSPSEKLSAMPQKHVTLGEAGNCLQGSVAVCYSDGEFEFCNGFAVLTVPFCQEEIDEWNSVLSRLSLICFDCKAFYKSLEALGLLRPNCDFDVMLAAYVLDAGSGKFELSALLERYDSEGKIDRTSQSTCIWGLYSVLKDAIEQQGTQQLLYEIEQPLAGVLADMETVGFRIDVEGIRHYGEDLKLLAEDLQNRIYSYAGEAFNISSPKQLGEVLFDKMGLPKSKKTKTGYSTDAETLQKLLPYHPIIEDILEYRQVTKLKSTYADGLVKAADENGRVHSIFSQTGTATGRLSSSEPNLQNIPIKTELGRQFRRYFIPTNDDYVLLDADYSQIELRILAHVANDEAMIQTFLSGADIHTMTATKVFGVAEDQVTVDLRKRAKAVNFGILYGMGEYSLSEDLGISRKQAKQYIDGYLSGFPRVCDYLEQVKMFARKNGYVATEFGRRRYIPELSSSNKNLQHFGERVAMNSPIQGTAADIIKIAMIRINHALKKCGLDARLILQVHDELLLEVNRSCADEAMNVLQTCMEEAVCFRIPMSVEAHMGRNWFEAK